ncbi:MAG TPA: tetratricopeptide repeat protein, partial [Planctomycetota bacterium]|nr:tetratricopeptide repeat protein [Planctomycetota bacterium]
MVSRSRFPRSASLFLCVLVLIALDGFARADELEEKLLRAELLEVSAGDLPKAMEAYKAIQADEKAPAELRARAQLNLGRCQRKLGELEGAKRTFEELIAAHPGEREVVRQAQGFLRELQGGKPENPQFDWLKELEKSPEIQARVFDLCMDLASNDRASSARRQLRALGTVAVSGMERVLQVSRDDSQKRDLALTLVQCGRYERLGMLLDPESPPDWSRNSFLMEHFVIQIPTLPEATRQGIIGAADRITDPRLVLHVSLLRLLAGDRRDLGAQMKAIEPLLTFGDNVVADFARSFLARLAKDAPAADFMATRILEDECP